MDLYEIIEDTLDYRWRHGRHNAEFPVHTYPREGWHIRPHLIMVCPHDGPYQATVEDGHITYPIKRNEVVLIPPHTSLSVHQPKAGRQSYAHIQFSILGGLDHFHFLNYHVAFWEKKPHRFARHCGS